MFKIKSEYHGILVKSEDIQELWKFIVSNPNMNFLIFRDYTPLSRNDFLTTYLKETGDYKAYMMAHKSLIKTKPLQSYEV